MKMLLPYTENFLLFALAAFLGLYTDKLNKIEIMTGLDYSQVYILLMGLIYGKKQSLIAAFLSTVLYFYRLQLKGIDSVAAIYDVENSMHLLSYLFMAIIVGYITDKHNFAMRGMLDEIAALSKNKEFLNKSYQEALRLKNKFYSQIINSKDSIGWLYNALKKLYNIKSEKIYSAAIEVVTEMMGTENAVIAVVNQAPTQNNIFLRRKIKKGMVTASFPISLKLSEHDFLDKVVNKKEIFVNRLLEKNVPDMSAPVIVNNEVIAVISVYNIPFEYFSLHYERTMLVISMMLAESLGQARQYEKETHANNYVGNTRIMRPVVFKETEDILRQRGPRSYRRFKVMAINGISVENNSSEIEKLAPYLQSAVREQDYMGFIGASVFILMESLSEDMIEVVEERFKRKEIIISLAD